jgi:hypothetical protein
MAVDYSGLDIALVAAEDLSSYQYCFVVQDTDGTVRLANAATDVPLGVLQNAPASGEEAIVRIMGTSKLVMNDAVAVGARLKMEYVSTSDNGKGDAADTEGDQERGICIFASGAEDDVGAILLIFNETSVPA